jgi:hypothetical protein
MKPAAEWARELDGIAFSEDIEKIQQDARAELVEIARGLLRTFDSTPVSELAEQVVEDPSTLTQYLVAARAALKETT